MQICNKLLKIEIDECSVLMALKVANVCVIWKYYMLMALLQCHEKYYADIVARYII